MSPATASTDVLKLELKAWEKAFKEEHGRIPGKQDIKAHPEIGAKYKLYNQTRRPAAPPPVKQVDPLTTPRPQRKTQRGPAPKSIFNKELPAASAAPLATSNPFSPVKRKVPTDLFDASPSKAVAFRLAYSNKTHVSSSIDEPDNPFMVSPTSKSAKGTHLFSLASPTKKSTLEPFVSPATLPSSSSSVAAHTETTSHYVYADSPKKLRALIQSASTALRDTPRTKSRKRLRGEEVTVTPGDKRRRVVARQAVEETMVDEDDEEIALSPSKPVTLGPRGKPFQPVFDDELPRKLASTKTKPLFFSGSIRPGGTSKQLSKLETQVPASRTPSAVSSDRPLGLRFDGRNDLAAGSDSTPVEETTAVEPTNKKGGRANAKRSFAEADNDAEIIAPDAQAGPPKLPSTMTNPYGLRPPSPILAAAGKGKGKGKWGDRKKGKTEKAGEVLEDGAGEEDDEEEPMVVKDVEWARWGSLRPSCSRSAPNQTSTKDGETPMDDPIDRYRAKASQPPVLPTDSPSRDSEAEIYIDLPDEIRRVLHIDSPSKQRRKNEEKGIMHGLLNGKAPPPGKLKGQEIWGVGEFDGGEDEEDERDWNSEPEGWVGAVEM